MKSIVMAISKHTHSNNSSHITKNTLVIDRRYDALSSPIERIGKIVLFMDDDASFGSWLGEESCTRDQFLGKYDQGKHISVNCSEAHSSFILQSFDLRDDWYPRYNRRWHVLVDGDASYSHSPRKFAYASLLQRSIHTACCNGSWILPSHLVNRSKLQRLKSKRSQTKKTIHRSQVNGTVSFLFLSTTCNSLTHLSNEHLRRSIW